jgi:hypothetical protein
MSQADLDVLDGILHSYGSCRAPLPLAATHAGLVDGFKPKLGARCDASRNFISTGGRFGHREEPRWLLRARTSYFRELYAHGGSVSVEGIETILGNEALIAAARGLYGMPVVVPYLAYGNMLVPGQELGLHTDVPAFRGADRTGLPLWLLVVMRHSGLFERWRISIATAVAFVGDCAGGEFAYYPNGETGPGRETHPDSGAAIVLDADSIFHGVDRVSGDDTALRTLGSRPMQLASRGDRTWQLRRSSSEMPGPEFAFSSDQLRFSMSWKAYCFEDEHERSVWEAHTDDLRCSAIIGALTDEMCRRGVVARDHGLSDAELGFLMIDTFVRFPKVA